MKSRMTAEKQFRKDPNKFASNLFNKEQNSCSPTFSSDTAQQYFEETYRDDNRNYTYSPLLEMERPNLPSSFFVMRCPTMSEIRRSIHRKRNGAAPGLNGLPYLPFKKCAALQTFIHQLAQKVWKTRNVPTDWAEAFIALL